MAAQWTEHAERKLQEAGLRRGGARLAVVEQLGRGHCALTARDVEEAVRRGGREVGRASVYRALEQLVGLGLITRIDVGDGIARYEAAHPSGEHHHHMICDDCGVVAPFEDAELERSLEHLAGRLSFRVDDHEVVLHGSCGCREVRRRGGSGRTRGAAARA